MSTPIRLSGRLSLLLALTLPLLVGSATTDSEAVPRRTRFSPPVHGLKFQNTFSNDLIEAFDIRTGGLCGGMVYTALDYFHARRRVPQLNYRPANRTVLQSYIWGRQDSSIRSNLDKWAELGFNPGGARNAEIFRWGLQGSRGGRLAELRQMIDSGRPAPLGLQEFGGKVGDRKRPGNHQVLAIGYDLGRYRGDLGAHKEDLKIFVYDPNYPGRTMTLVPDVRRESYYYTGSNDLKHNGEWYKRWRTYFVDRKYQAKTPPAYREPRRFPDGSIDELLVVVDTGDDDLRGGRDNVGLTVQLADGSKIVVRNISRSARWLSNYTEHARVRLNRVIKPGDITALRLDTTFRGGIGGDNWDAKRVIIQYADARGTRQVLVQRRAFYRFTGDRRSLVLTPKRRAATAGPGQITHLLLDIRTGGDDLRGNQDNLNVTINFRNRSKQVIATVNARKRWGNNTSNTVRLQLRRPVNRNQIVGVTLTTTFRGGMGGDNWNMDSLAVRPFAGGAEQSPYYRRSGRPLFRFTGNRRTFRATW